MDGIKPTEDLMTSMARKGTLLAPHGGLVVTMNYQRHGMGTGQGLAMGIPDKRSRNYNPDYCLGARSKMRNISVKWQSVGQRPMLAHANSRAEDRENSLTIES